MISLCGVRWVSWLWLVSWFTPKLMTLPCSMLTPTTVSKSTKLSFGPRITAHSATISFSRPMVSPFNGPALKGADTFQSYRNLFCKWQKKYFSVPYNIWCHDKLLRPLVIRAGCLTIQYPIISSKWQMYRIACVLSFKCTSDSLYSAENRQKEEKRQPNFTKHVVKGQISPFKG